MISSTFVETWAFKILRPSTVFSLNLWIRLWNSSSVSISQKKTQIFHTLFRIYTKERKSNVLSSTTSDKLWHFLSILSMLRFFLSCFSQIACQQWYFQGCRTNSIWRLFEFRSLEFQKCFLLCALVFVLDIVLVKAGMPETQPINSQSQSKNNNLNTLSTDKRCWATLFNRNQRD